jgi:hypothetical protein
MHLSAATLMRSTVLQDSSPENFSQAAPSYRTCGVLSHYTNAV